MIAALLAWTAAHAADWRDPKPYIAPVVNLSLISVNGNTSAQAAVGAVGGVRVRYSGQPHWLSHSRAMAVGSYGLNTGSLGGDLRLGSFFGPDGKLAQLQVGPDLWYQGYGKQGAADYWLPWAPGLDLRSVATLKLAREVHIVGEASPGFVFLEERRSDQVKPFDQLSLAAMLVIRAPFARLTIGYSRQYNSYGVVEGLILSGAL
ncbi:MAG: hypothetical protein KC621_02575 [Myxococcales bacterium]|nr:hypothetical protein [Myxococcales bacterium]